MFAAWEHAGSQSVWHAAEHPFLKVKSCNTRKAFTDFCWKPHPLKKKKSPWSFCGLVLFSVFVVTATGLNSSHFCFSLLRVGITKAQWHQLLSSLRASRERPPQSKVARLWICKFTMLQDQCAVQINLDALSFVFGFYIFGLLCFMCLCACAGV